MRTIGVGLAILAAGCSSSDGATPREAGSFSVTSVAWNVDASDVGRVAAVAESAGDVALFGDKGAQVFAGGALASTDETVTEWRAGAAVIPAPDSTETWLVAPSADGHVYRLRALSTLEDVSDRYGLGDASVDAIVAGSGPWVVFGLENGIAVADGKTVTRYDGTLKSLTAYGSRAAGILPDGSVEVVDLSTMKAATYAKLGAVATAFDGSGKLWVETAHELFEESAGALETFYRNDGLLFHGLAFGGGHLWFAAGAELGLVDGEKVSLAKAEIPSDAAIVGSPSGDVWTLSGGQLARFGVPVTGDEADWRTGILPVYARVCSQCHAPGGTAGTDLSTYGAWTQRRKAIYQRVVVDKNMPQGQAISDDDLQAVSTWTQAMP
jgi:mono/diheme cytochrome c family protein